MSDCIVRLLCATMIGLPLMGLSPAHAVKPFFPRNPPETVEPTKPAKRKTMGPASHLPLPLQEARKRLLAGKKVSYGELQALADAKDGIGAFKLAERIQKQGDPKLATDALHYFSIAAYQDRGYAVRHMMDILGNDSLELSPSHLTSAETALRLQARKGNDKAVEGLIRLYSEGRVFGDKRHELEALLTSGVGRKNGDTAFKLAVLLLSDRNRTPEQTEQATRFLAIAEENGSLGMKAAASNLLAQLQTKSSETTAEVQQ
ncbi:hypothetical protein [Rhizobium rhizophilum]|uniref:Sel1 repeat family protein n=1 Tax=Rhizobium rhizophilum TaxID=1850373 RepID=A0ABY2QVE3_9HYPH|nr:hypothetical protein [Rhizobium rhizophilum]THV15048.1 hypothetical protein E9677_06695 [Rhizobium rhizophilum]